MMAVQVNFSTKDFAFETVNRIEQSIRSNECNLRQDQKIEDANKTPNELTIATNRINELTAQIRGFNEYDGLRAIMIQHLKDLEDDITEKLKEKNKIIEIVAPFLKLPLNPFAVVRFIKKFILGDKLPQIMAAINLALQIIKLLDALNQLQQEIRNAVEKLEEFVKSFPDFIVNEAQNTLDRAVLNIKADIQDKITAAICGELKKEDVTIDDARNVLTLIEQGRNALQAVNQLALTVSNDLASSLSSISDIQNDIVSATGQTPAIDTSSGDAFIQSVESGAASEFITEAETIASEIDANEGISNVREFNVILDPPLKDSNVAFGVISTANGFISTDFSDWSIAKQLDNPTANLVFNVTVNDVPQGNLTLTTTGEVIKNTANTQVNLLVNDIVNIVTPADASTAGANTRVYFTIKINEVGTGTP